MFASLLIFIGAKVYIILIVLSLIAVQLYEHKYVLHVCYTHTRTYTHNFPLLQLTAIRDQMHSKGGYEHSVHVPAEATPSGQDISTLVSLLKLCFYYWVGIDFISI